MKDSNTVPCWSVAVNACLKNGDVSEAWLTTCPESAHGWWSNYRLQTSVINLASIRTTYIPRTHANLNIPLDRCYFHCSYLAPSLSASIERTRAHREWAHEQAREQLICSEASPSRQIHSLSYLTTVTTCFALLAPPVY